MFQQILSPATRRADDGVVFATALAAGCGTAAHPGVLHIRQDPVSVAVGMAGGYGMSLMMDAVERSDVVAEAAARAGCASATLQVETGFLIAHDWTADLVVMGYLSAAAITAIETAALFSIGISKDSMLEYEATVKADGFPMMAHGSAEEIVRAKAIRGTTRASRLETHGAAPAAPPEVIALGPA